MMTAETYLKSVYHRVNNSVQNFRRSLNPARFYADRTLNQVKTRENASLTLRETPNIVVEINNTCNLNCIMCRTKNAKRPKGTMSTDDFVWILDKIIKPKRQKVLVVHTVGEPLMHPQFDEIVDEVYKRNIRLLITTNGLFLKKHSRIFKKYPGLFAGINVSIDGASKETYDKIRIGGKFDVLIENLKWLADINERLKLKIPVRIQSILSNDNLHEIPDYFRVYTEYVCPENISFNLVSNLSSNREREGYFFSKNILAKEPALNAPCPLPFVQLHILFDGRISACCRDYNGELVMGDIKKDNWKDIWLGEKYENMRKLHRIKKTEDLPMCGSCYGAPFAFTVLLSNYIQYLVYTDRIGEGGLDKKIDRLFKEFSVLYHNKDYDLSKLTKILEINK